VSTAGASFRGGAIVYEDQGGHGAGARSNLGASDDEQDEEEEEIEDGDAFVAAVQRRAGAGAGPGPGGGGGTKFDPFAEADRGSYRRLDDTDGRHQPHSGMSRLA